MIFYDLCFNCFSATTPNGSGLPHSRSF